MEPQSVVGKNSFVVSLAEQQRRAAVFALTGSEEENNDGPYASRCPECDDIATSADRCANPDLHCDNGHSWKRNIEAAPSAKEIALGLGLALAPSPAAPAKHEAPKKQYVCPDKGQTWTCEEPRITPKAGGSEYEECPNCGADLANHRLPDGGGIMMSREEIMENASSKPSKDLGEKPPVDSYCDDCGADIKHCTCKNFAHAGTSVVEEMALAAYGKPLEDCTYDELFALQQALKDSLPQPPAFVSAWLSTKSWDDQEHEAELGDKLRAIVAGTEFEQNVDLAISDLGVYAALIGLYWYCADNHEGQSSDAYSVLSQLGPLYEPGRATNGPEDDSAEAIAYELYAGSQYDPSREHLDSPEEDQRSGPSDDPHEASADDSAGPGGGAGSNTRDPNTDPTRSW